MSEAKVWVSSTIYRVELTDDPLELGAGEEIVRTSYDSPHFNVYIRTPAGNDD